MSKRERLRQLERMLTLNRHEQRSDYHTNAATNQVSFEDLGLTTLGADQLDSLITCIELKYAKEDTFDWRRYPLPSILCQVPFYAYAYEPIDDSSVSVMFYGTLCRYCCGDLQSTGTMNLSGAFQNASLKEQLELISFVGAEHVLATLPTTVSEAQATALKTLISKSPAIDSAPPELQALLTSYGESLVRFSISSCGEHQQKVIRDYAYFLEQTIWKHSHRYTNDSDDPGVFLVRGTGISCSLKTKKAEWCECFSFRGQRSLQMSALSEHMY